MSNVEMSLDEARKLAMVCLLHNGCDAENAEAIVDVVIQAEADRCQSHGLFRIPWYAKGVRSGRVNGNARPYVEQLAPAVIQVNGDNGYAPLGQNIGLPALGECARETGIAALGFTRMFHISALWPETQALAEMGLVAFAFTASYPSVAPAGGIKPLYGTNPMGFAWPRKNAPPVVFDQASSFMARGEVQIASRDGHSVPKEAGIGPDGEETTDPNVVLKGAQLAFGGYKGASIALMIELIAGPMIGEFLSFEAIEDDGGQGGPPKGGELIVAIDPAMFGNADGFLEHGERLFAEIAKQEGTRLPGERRFQARKETAANGISVSKTLLDEIQAMMQ